MYIPKSFENKDIKQLHQFIEQYSFTTLISHHQKNFQASHLPLLLKKNKAPYGTLTGHFAKQNPHAHLIGHENNDVLCIFHGPHSYISPTWYKTHPSVPTWNYAVVHAYGKLQAITQEELAQDLKQLLNHHESLLKENSDYVIPLDYQKKLLEHIIGFKIEILSLEGKYKLGQNRSMEDQLGMLQGLHNANTHESILFASFMEAHQKRNNSNPNPHIPNIEE